MNGGRDSSWWFWIYLIIGIGVINFASWWPQRRVAVLEFRGRHGESDFKKPSNLIMLQGQAPNSLMIRSQEMPENFGFLFAAAASGVGLARINCFKRPSTAWMIWNVPMRRAPPAKGYAMYFLLTNQWHLSSLVPGTFFIFLWHHPSQRHQNLWDC